ncbi:MAG: PTS sugar transporter subunit IIA [Pseudolactococcus laudensis]
MDVTKENILLDLAGFSKADILNRISDYAFKINVVNNVTQTYLEFIHRENEVSTGFTKGIAIPHAKTDAVLKPTILYIRLRDAVDWSTLDDSLVTDIFALLVPEHHIENLHLKMISILASELMEEEFMETIRNLSKKEDIANYLMNKMLVEEL